MGVGVGVAVNGEGGIEGEGAGRMLNMIERQVSTEGDRRMILILKENGVD